MNGGATNDYGIYGTQSWRAASSEAGVSHPPHAVDDATGLELHVVAALGGLRLLVPPGTGRTMGLYSGPSWRGDASETMAEVVRAGRELEAHAIFLPGLWATDADAIIEARSAAGDGWRARMDDDGVASVQPVGRGLEQMLELVPKKERKPTRRRIRRLQELDDVEIRTIRDAPERDELFRRFVELHNQEWQARGRQGHYVDWPEAAILHQSLLQGSGAGMITGVFQAGEPVALQLGFVVGTLASAINLARHPDNRELDQFSPATVAFLSFAGAAGELGAERVELGRGSYDYKRKLGATEEPLRRILVVRSGAANSIRVGFGRGLSSALQRLYYRLWFNRLSPRLGIRPGPLWWPWRMRI